MKICTNELGHMTNMATMPIYGKNLKNLLLQNQLTNDLKLSICHRVREYYQGYTYYDPGLTMTFFTPRSYLVI